MRKIKKNNRIWIESGKEKRIVAAMALALLSTSLVFGQELGKWMKTTFDLRKEIIGKVQERTCETYFPVFSFMQENTKKKKDTTILEEVFGGSMPLYEYARTHSVLPAQAEGGSLVRELTEGSKEKEQDGKNIPESDMIEAVKQENAKVNFTEPKEAEKVASIDRNALVDYETLVSEFYAIDSTTHIGRDQLNVGKLTEPDMTLQQKDSSKPQILIYHTHSQEGFADSVPGDDATTIIGAGEKLARLLREKYGFNVIHHTGKYDVESRDYAYSNAAPAVEQILAENPSIEVIIDLHRDQMPEETKLVTDIGGRPTARFMFFNGLSRTNKTGEIDYLENPNLENNLAFSFQMQLAAGEYYPGITRKIYLKGYRYNMHYRGKSLLVEMGAQNNTVEEIMNACDPLAHILFLVLSGEA